MPIVAFTDFHLKASMGVIPGLEIIQRYGENPDVDNGTFETIWGAGGDYTGFNAVGAEIVTLVSDSTSDTSAGVGARTVFISGLASNYSRFSQFVTMNGTTPVDTAGSFVRVDEIYVVVSGSSKANVGTITANQKVTTANVFGHILPGYNSSLSAVYTIPTGFTGYITEWTASFAGGNNANLVARLITKVFAESAIVKEGFALATAGTSTRDKIFRHPLGPFPAKTDIKLMVNSDTSDSQVAGGFGLTLVKD